MKTLLALCLALLLPHALAATPQFGDPVQEARYYDMIHIIRCPTCQNQNVAESEAPLARQLREHIEAQIKEGRSDQEITAYLVERYGDFITYAPPFAARTWLLWLAPFAVMAATLTLWLMRRRPRTPTEHLTPAQHAELQELLTQHRKQP